jgi:hypothetical protein
MKTGNVRLFAVVTALAILWTLGSGMALAAAHTRYVAPTGSDVPTPA